MVSATLLLFHWQVLSSLTKGLLYKGCEMLVAMLKLHDWQSLESSTSGA